MIDIIIIIVIMIIVIIIIIIIITIIINIIITTTHLYGASLHNVGTRPLSNECVKCYIFS